MALFNHYLRPGAIRIVVFVMVLALAFIPVRQAAHWVRTYSTA